MQVKKLVQYINYLTLASHLTIDYPLHIQPIDTLENIFPIRTSLNRPLMNISLSTTQNVSKYPKSLRNIGHTLHTVANRTSITNNHSIYMRIMTTISIAINLIYMTNAKTSMLHMTVYTTNLNMQHMTTTLQLVSCGVSFHLAELLVCK